MPARITHSRDHDPPLIPDSLGVPVRINGLILTALIALGVVMAYDKAKAGALRKGV